MKIGRVITTTYNDKGDVLLTQITNNIINNSVSTNEYTYNDDGTIKRQIYIMDNIQVVNDYIYDDNVTKIISIETNLTDNTTITTNTRIVKNDVIMSEFTFVDDKLTYTEVYDKNSRTIIKSFNEDTELIIQNIEYDTNGNIINIYKNGTLFISNKYDDENNIIYEKDNTTICVYNYDKHNRMISSSSKSINTGYTHDTQITYEGNTEYIHHSITYEDGYTQQYKRTIINDGNVIRKLDDDGDIMSESYLDECMREIKQITYV